MAMGKAQGDAKNKPGQSHMLWITDWTDPTFLFGVNTLFSVVFVEGIRDEKRLSFRPLENPDKMPGVLFDFVTDPCFVVALVALLVTRYCVGDRAIELSAGMKRSAGWYLWNGVIFHIMMDGMAGGHWGNKLMDANYRLLDRRFNPGQAHPGDQALACLMVNMELFGHSVLCFITYIGMVTGAVWACEMEIATLMLQLVGMIVFVGPDYMTGCMNMVPHNVSGCIPGFSSYEFFYYWFGVGVNIVWGVVPLVMLHDAFKRSIAMKVKGKRS